MNYLERIERILEPRNMVGIDQILAILDYMKDRPQLAHSRFTRTKEGRSLLKRHWAACADLANNVSSNCAHKTPDQWRAYYNAYKSKLKKKVKDIKAELVATGGGPVKKKLSDVENRLYLILGPDLGERLPRVCNTPVSSLETDYQPPSSTAEVTLQDDACISIGSDSSEVELYYPVEHSNQMTADQQLEPVVQTNQQLEPVVHTDKQLEPVVHTGQQPVPVVHTDHHLESIIHTDQQLKSVFHTGQQLKPVIHTGQQPECVVQSDQLKKKTVEGSPRRARRSPSSEQDGGGDPNPIREAAEALLKMEQMKTEAKRDATAALHRLAGAMEALAERLTGPVRLQIASPPRTRRRYARISSSESD